MDWRESAALRIKKMPPEALAVRQSAMDDLYTFARLVNPGYVYGDVHKEVFQFLQNVNLFGVGEASTENKLLMLPRSHLKSHCMATWAAWIITKHPEVTILYLSATAELAEVQLYAIKRILESKVYQRYWPEYINPNEGSREKWTERKIIIDHEKRIQENVRDATVATAGLTTNTTGWHADIIIADDLVVPENAYTEDGRNAVRKKASQFTSIRNAGGFTMACGTRYHPVDIYFTWKMQKMQIYHEVTGELIEERPIWEIFERVVEIDGVFLWPRTVREDGKAFGFDRNVLSRISGEYEDRTQFSAQYYNNPNDEGSARINRDKFQYYDPRHVKWNGSKWLFKDRPLNIYASIDFAFSLNKRADSSAIVVIGIDPDGMIYVLDIDRFKTDKALEYFRRIALMHSKWFFRKMRAEVTVAQQVLVNAIKDYMKTEGLQISIDEYRPNRHEGNKEERIAAILEHRYDNLTIWHFNGGFTPMLEDELVQVNPAHDDIKDSLANAIAIAIKPKHTRSVRDFGIFNQNTKGSRFGGVPFRQG